MPTNSPKKADTPANARKPEGEATWRVYVANVADPRNPTIQLVFLQANKHGPAWKAARRLVSTGKPHDEVPQTTTFFSDEACQEPANVGHGDHLTIANVLDVNVREPKLTPARLKSILEDDSASAEEQLAAMRKLLMGEASLA